MTISVIPGAGGTLSNTAITSTTAIDAAPGNNSSTTTTLVTTAPVYWTLTAEMRGSGMGDITSDPVGVDCGFDCSGSFLEGAPITLTASVDLRVHISMVGSAAAATALGPARRLYSLMLPIRQSSTWRGLVDHRKRLFSRMLSSTGRRRLPPANRSVPERVWKSRTVPTWYCMEVLK